MNDKISLEKAHEAFDDYLSGFDQENEKIKLKMVHTDGVVRCAREIARRMGLSEEDCQLAELIALLHDIGRFEQVRRFDSFEPVTMDHATYGVELLFSAKDQKTGKNNVTDKQKSTEKDHVSTERKSTDENIWLRDFVASPKWDQIIKEAIGRHSLYAIGDLEDERTLLHAKLIRDADKLDNCRVKLEDSIHILLGMGEEEAGRLPMSEVIWKTCLEHKSVLSMDRVTKMDYWVSYIAYFFDINFQATYEIIKENQYVDRIIDRIPYSNPDTKEKMEVLRRIMNHWVFEGAKKYRYYMFYKPYGCVTARKDDIFPTVMDYFKDLPEFEELSPVGRLDRETEGLLFVTNDGQWNQKMTHPDFKKEKRYEFILLGELSEDDKLRLEAGVYLKGCDKITAPCKVEIAGKTSLEEVENSLPREVWEATKHNRPDHPVVFGRITITEGRKRQIRRMFKEVHCLVLYLKRVQIDGFKLDENLKPGEYREIQIK